MNVQVDCQCSRKSFQNFADHSFSYFCLYVSGILLKSYVDLCLPLGDGTLETFLYLGLPFFPSFILFRKPSTQSQVHQCLQSLVIEGLGETQHNTIFPGA